MLRSLYYLAVLVEVDVDEVEEELGRIGSGWHVISYSVEVLGSVVDGPEITRLAHGQQRQFVEQLIGHRRRLVDRGDDDELGDPVSPGIVGERVGTQGTHVIPPGDILDIFYHFCTQSRVQTTRRFIQEENSWVRDEAARYTKALLLAATEAFLDGCSDNSMGLSLQSKAGNQVVDPVDGLLS